MRRASLLATIFLGLLISLFHLVSAYLGYPFFRDHHLGTALIFMNEGVDLFRPEIVGFNANNVPTIQEFPIWQAGAGMMMRLLGGWWGGANGFSLLVFSLAIIPIYRMGKRFLGKEGAWWAVAFFLIQPVVFENAGMASADGMSLVVALWAYDRIRAFAFKGGWSRAASAGLLAALAAILKAPFFMAAGLAVAFEVLPMGGRIYACWIRLATVALFSCTIFWGWTQYANSWFEKALWPLVDLRVGHNPEMAYWFFGDWAYRLSPGVWVKAGWRAANALLGSLPLAGVALLGWIQPQNREGRSWLYGALVTTGIFSHLVLHHGHYYLMFSPAVAIGMAGGSLWLLKRCCVANETCAKIAAAGAFILMVGALVQGLLGREVVSQFDPQKKAAPLLVQKLTHASDRLLIAGGGWGGETLFRAKRQGLSIWNTRFLEDPDNLERVKRLGFTKLVIIRESPLMVALQKTNPGGANYSAEPFSHHLSPVADSFPAVYEDEQLMIRQIPPR